MGVAAKEKGLYGLTIYSFFNPHLIRSKHNMIPILHKIDSHIEIPLNGSLAAVYQSRYIGTFQQRFLMYCFVFISFCFLIQIFRRFYALERLRRKNLLFAWVSSSRRWRDSTDALCAPCRRICSHGSVFLMEATYWTSSCTQEWSSPPV